MLIIVVLTVLSRLDGYATGSLIHLLLHNLLSFTLERIGPGFGVLDSIGLLALGAFLLDESLLRLLFDGLWYLSGAMNLLDTRSPVNLTGSVLQIE